MKRPKVKKEFYRNKNGELVERTIIIKDNITHQSDKPAEDQWPDDSTRYK